MKYAILLTCFKSQEGECYCIVKPFEALVSMEEAIENELDCPLLELEERIEVIRSNKVTQSVSIIHECTHTCIFKSTSKRIIEREQVTSEDGLTYHHDKTNNIYCLNVYKI